MKFSKERGMTFKQAKGKEGIFIEDESKRLIFIVTTTKAFNQNLHIVHTYMYIIAQHER